MRIVIASEAEAIHRLRHADEMDCFVAPLLAMTVYTCGATRFSTFTPSRSSMISAIHCRWQWAWSRS